MEENDQKSLTVGDILDQLVKPSVIQGPVKQPSPPAVPTPISKPILPLQKSSEGVKLPQLSQEKNRSQSGITLSGNQASGPILTIRTMADDLARIRQGKAPVGQEVRITSSLLAQTKIQIPLPPPKNEEPLPQISDRPAVPSVPKIPSMPKVPIIPTLPKISVLPDISEIPKAKMPFGGLKPIIPPLTSRQDKPAFIHDEIHIDEKDNLPEFPGALVPKLKPKTQNEKVEYGVIAKIVSRGMLSGIIATIVFAVGAYFLITYYFFNEDPTLDVIPTPTPVGTPSGEINELKAIFRTVSSVSFYIPVDTGKFIPDLMSFIQNESLPTKEFRRVDFRIIKPEVEEKPTFIELFDKLGIRLSEEFKNSIQGNYEAFIYGQEESFNKGGEEQTDKRIVFIVEVNDAKQILEVMNKWELTIAEDFKVLFNIDPSRRATAAFLDNERRGVITSYMNFPLPDKSIDYSVVTSLSGKNYLIITNSRESMYSPADRIRGL